MRKIPYSGAFVVCGICGVYFVVAVAIGGLLGLSLANAVFVDEMTMDNTDELEAKIDRLIDKVESLEAELKTRG